MTERAKSHDFIVTGASGNIGRRLIPGLANKEYRILALGRNVSALRQLYRRHPTVECADYSNIDQYSSDTVIHLAVRNNSQPGSIEDFRRDNTEFSYWISKFFSECDTRFINLSSIQELEDNQLSPYALSKAESSQRMRDILGRSLDNVYIGYFYGGDYFGERFRFLEKIGSLGGFLFHLFKTIKPTTSISIIMEYIHQPFEVSHDRILTDNILLSRTYRYLTRFLDIMVSFSLLLVFSPFFLALWALIKIDSPGPAIFSQQRVGKDQAPFTLYKFRTMKRGTVAAGTHEVSVSAVTKVGGFLRKTKLDELPQAINLLRGEMTLVGPRPCLPMQKELIEARAALGVYAMKPGITGYAQIRGIDMSRPQDLAQADYIYMKLQSLTLNFKILILTAFGRGSGDRVAVSDKL